MLDGIVSPKVSLIFGPFAKNEFYLNFGTGFHSNDARGTTISTSPATGEAATRVPALVRSQGAEIGLRSSVLPGLISTVALWYLNLDSELVFVGDAGDTSDNCRSLCDSVLRDASNLPAEQGGD